MSMWILSYCTNTVIEGPLEILIHLWWAKKVDSMTYILPYCDFIFFFFFSFRLAYNFHFSGEVRIFNSYIATKLWLNHDTPKFNEFKRKYISKWCTLFLVSYKLSILFMYPHHYFNLRPLYTPLRNISSSSRLSNSSTM